jgi:hypothetical protein
MIGKKMGGKLTTQRATKVAAGGFSAADGDIPAVCPAARTTAVQCRRELTPQEFRRTFD